REPDQNRHNYQQDQRATHQTSPCSCNPEMRRYDRPAVAAYAGERLMKVNARTAGRRVSSTSLLALALAMPVATGSAQAPQVAAQVAAIVAPASASAPIYQPPPVETMPLANGFDVRLFEAMAQEIVANQRVPGLAMAIVH